MEQSNISIKQLFILILLFEQGSASVVNLGISAKQDAWLAILLGMTAGLILFLIHGYLHVQYPNLALTSYIQVLLGKYIGMPVALCYILYFFYLAARVLRDFEDLLITTSLQNTPILVVGMMMMAVISCAIYYGIEVISRTVEIIFIFIVIVGSATIAAIILSQIIHLENLLPVLENGWKPVLKTAFPLTFTFPFGEMIVFFMLLPYTKNPKSTIKTGLAGMLTAGIILSVIMILNISILGVYKASLEQFPFLRTLGAINVAEVIQRFDAIALSILIIGGFIKILIFFYAAIYGIRDVFALKKQKQTIYMLSIFAPLIIAYSVAMAPSFPKHIDIGLKQVPYYLHIPMQTVIPIFLVIIAFVKQRLQKQK